MNKYAKLVNFNLSEYCESFCAVLENTQAFEQELKALCKQNEIDLYADSKLKMTSVLINDIKMKLKLDEQKVEVAKQIIDARNKLVHSFFINPTECIKSININGITLSFDYQEFFYLINTLLFEIRDFFGNISDKTHRPNYIDGDYNPIDN